MMPPFRPSREVRLKPDAAYQRTGRPPRLADWLLRHALPRDVRGDAMRGDLLEEFRERNAAPCRAWWYWRHALAVSWRYVQARHRDHLREHPSMWLEST